jgi:hypothetical protein
LSIEDASESSSAINSGTDDRWKDVAIGAHDSVLAVARLDPTDAGEHLPRKTGARTRPKLVRG